MSYTPYVWKNSPDKTTPINAENLNRMEEGIQEALAKSSESCSYVQSAGERYADYYYEVYKYTVDNADSLISNAGLTNPYYYYEIEGWAKCTSISEDGFIAYFSPEFQSISPDIIDGNNLFYENNGNWVALPQVLFLGTMDSNNYAFIKRNEIEDALIDLHADIKSIGSGTLGNLIKFSLLAEILPTTSPDYIFTSNDINNLYIYFRIKIDQVRRTSVG